LIHRKKVPDEFQLCQSQANSVVAAYKDRYWIKDSNGGCGPGESPGRVWAGANPGIGRVIAFNYGYAPFGNWFPSRISQPAPVGCKYVGDYRTAIGG